MQLLEVGVLWLCGWGAGVRVEVAHCAVQECIFYTGTRCTATMASARVRWWRCRWYKQCSLQHMRSTISHAWVITGRTGTCSMPHAAVHEATAPMHSTRGEDCSKRHVRLLLLLKGVAQCRLQRVGVDLTAVLRHEGARGRFPDLLLSVRRFIQCAIEAGRAAHKEGTVRVAAGQQLLLIRLPVCSNARRFLHDFCLSSVVLLFIQVRIQGAELVYGFLCVSERPKGLLRCAVRQNGGAEQLLCACQGLQLRRQGLFCLAEGYVQVVHAALQRYIG